MERFFGGGGGNLLETTRFEYKMYRFNVNFAVGTWCVSTTITGLNRYHAICFARTIDVLPNTVGNAEIARSAWKPSLVPYQQGLLLPPAHESRSSYPTSCSTNSTPVRRTKYVSKNTSPAHRRARPP